MFSLETGNLLFLFLCCGLARGASPVSEEISNPTKGESDHMAPLKDGMGILA